MLQMKLTRIALIEHASSVGIVWPALYLTIVQCMIASSSLSVVDLCEVLLVCASAAQQLQLYAGQCIECTVVMVM